MGSDIMGHVHFILHRFFAWPTNSSLLSSSSSCSRCLCRMSFKGVFILGSTRVRGTDMRFGGDSDCMRRVDLLPPGLGDRLLARAKGFHSSLPFFSLFRPREEEDAPEPLS